MPTFFLVSSSFVLAFTLVLAIENEIPLTKPRSLTMAVCMRTANMLYGECVLVYLIIKFRLFLF